MKVLVSGATGFIGSALQRHLGSAGHEVVPLTRRPDSVPGPAVGWDPAAGRIDEAGLEGVDAAVHLAGESLLGLRWTEAKKRRLRESRIVSGRLLAEALARRSPRPSVLVSISGINFYGDRGDAVLDEGAPPGRGFLASLCVDWEAAADPARAAGIRVVHPRLGVVVGPGGFLSAAAPAFKAGIAGRVGSGRQWMSWIDLRDVVRVLALALERDDLEGPVNACSPHPVTNAEFTRTFGRVVHRPTIARLPAPLARLGLGQMGQEMLLDSVRAVPARLQAAGYGFVEPDFEGALRAALERRG